MTKVERFQLYYLANPFIAPRGSFVMRSVKTTEGMRVKHLIHALELNGISYYAEGRDLPFLEDDEPITLGEDYFLYLKDRRYTEERLNNWILTLKGIERRIAELS
ncbi:MAG: hypothetical protein ACP5NS_02370 [Candidatus Pacearchaeota archaeon]